MRKLLALLALASVVAPLTVGEPRTKNPQTTRRVVGTADLVGTWQGKYDGDAATLLITHGNGREFQGELSARHNDGSSVQLRIKVSFQPTSRRIIITETGFISTKGDWYQELHLDKYTGTLSADGRRMSGKVHDRSWSYSKKNPETADSLVGTPNLVGSWQGKYDGDAATLKITQGNGREFQGKLSARHSDGSTVQLQIKVSLQPTSRRITITETGFISTKGDWYQEMHLDKYTGTLSADGRRMSGNAHGRSWSYSKT